MNIERILYLFDLNNQRNIDINFHWLYIRTRINIERLETQHISRKFLKLYVIQDRFEDKLDNKI